MISKPLFMSTVFLLISFLYSSIGLYGLSLNKKSLINKLFFLACLTLAIWTTSFSIMCRTDNRLVALYFNNISVLGWGTFYSLIYHLFILLSSPKKKLSKRELAFIYVPALVNLILFSPLFGKAETHFNMVMTDWGWTNLTPTTFPNIYFSIYAFVFAILSLIKIFTWQKRADNESMRKKTRFIIVLYILNLALGIFSDMILNRILKIETIQLTAVWILLPMSYIFYTLIKYKVMHPKIKAKSDEIMTQYMRNRLFRVSGYLYVFFAYLAIFFSSPLDFDEMLPQLIFSLLMYLASIIHFFADSIFKKIKSRYLFMTITSIVVMVVMTFESSFNISITIWVLFFYYLLLSTIFEYSRYSIAIAVSIFLSQFIHYYNMRNSFSVGDWSDFFSKFFIIFVSVLVIYFLNLLYKNKIIENSRQINIQKTISYISTNMIDVNVDNLKDKSMTLLESIVVGQHYTRGYYYKLAPNKSEVKLLSYYDINDTESRTQKETLFEKALSTDALENDQPFIVNNLESLSSSQANIYDYLKRVGALGFYVYPISLSGRIRGILVLEFDHPKAISENMKDYETIILNLIKDTIRKIDYERTLYNNANYDKVTGIKNIDCFVNESKIILENIASGFPVIVFFDINNFKSINDAFGHMIGNYVLKETAQVLEKSLSKNSIFARFANDEFCFFLYDTKTKEDVEKQLDKIINAFKNPLLINNYEFRLSINMGVAKYPEDGDDIDTLLKNADLAMNKSKEIGKMIYHFCDLEDKKAVLENALYTNYLFNSLSNDEFVLAFQPQMSCKTGKIVGAEALIRWNSPAFGLVPPNKFIPILESTGLIIPVGEWIMEQVATQQAKMASMGLGNLRFSVNLSALQFQDSNLAKKLKNILEKWDIDPKLFELEITESLAINSDKFLSDTFADIKEIGCNIAIDDFGVEFSSLNRLQSLPIHRLKIDKLFIDGIGVDKKKESIIRVIIELARSLGLESIAEGVEEKKQVDFLQKNNCDEIQGYYYARPLFPEEFEAFTKNNI